MSSPIYNPTAFRTISSLDVFALFRCCSIDFTLTRLLDRAVAGLALRLAKMEVVSQLDPDPGTWDSYKAPQQSHLVMLLSMGKFGSHRTASNLVQLDVALEKHLLSIGKLEMSDVWFDNTTDLELARYLVWKRLYVLTGAQMTSRLIVTLTNVMRRRGLSDPTKVTEEMARASVTNVTKTLLEFRRLLELLEAKAA